MTTEGSGNGPSSLESSPKTTPKPIGGIDDLEGYRDLFHKPANRPSVNIASTSPLDQTAFRKRPDSTAFDSAASIAESSLSAEVELRRVKLEELERDYARRWGALGICTNSGRCQREECVTSATNRVERRADVDAEGPMSAPVSPTLCGMSLGPITQTDRQPPPPHISYRLASVVL